MDSVERRVEMDETAAARRRAAETFKARMEAQAREGK